MMEDLLVGGGSILFLVGLVVIAVLVLEWIFLPFAIFGTKDKLDQLIRATDQTNKLLEEILDEVVGPDLKSSDER